jgi:D-proline reductase (dithiol) PrdB
MDEDTGCVFGLKKGSIPCRQADANGPGEEFSMQLTRFYHQSVGLIQRIIESSGIPTISISINRPYTEKIKPPRSIFLDWPFGHPLGEPGNVRQLAAVLAKRFEALDTIDTPGMMMDVGWRRGRETYPSTSWLERPANEEKA